MYAVFENVILLCLPLYVGELIECCKWMGVCSVEVTLIRQAHEMGFLTTPYAFSAQEAHAMAMAGADIVVAHMGLTTAGSIGAKTSVSLEDSVRRVQSIADAAVEVNPEVVVLCHGGE
jgi:predicted TIM-barrel enzyme